MVKVRQDAWSHEDDLLLAETVLRHVREGSTQLNAFEEVGDHLNRTSAACGFRWNSEVRKKYHHALDIAKRKCKDKKCAEEHISVNNIQQKKQINEQIITQKQTTIKIDEIIHYLKKHNKSINESSQSKYA